MRTWDVGTKTFSSLPTPAPPVPHQKRRLRLRGLRPYCAKKPATSSSEEASPPPSLSKEEGSRFLSVSKTKSLLVRSGVALFGLGFVDAGYSGDWSRIGVISKETEDSLKLAAYIIVPFCLFLIFSVSEENKA